MSLLLLDRLPGAAPPRPQVHPQTASPADDGERTAVLAYRDYPATNDMIPNIELLVEALRRHRIRLLGSVVEWGDVNLNDPLGSIRVRPFAPGELDPGVPTLRLEKDQRFTTMPLGHIAVLLARTNLLHQAIELQPGLTVFNNFATKRYGDDKQRIYEDILNPAHERTVPTFAVTDEAGLQLALAQMPGAKLVAKPRDGHMSRGIIIGEREYVITSVHATLARATRENPALIVMQPHMDTTAPLPIQPGIDEDAERFERLNGAGRPKELRVYCFFNEGLNLGPANTFAVARSSPKGATHLTIPNSEWYVPDQQVLQAVTAEAQRAIDNLASRTASRAIYAAVDFMFAPDPATGLNPQWQIAEINVQFPAMLGTKRVPLSAARTLRVMYAQQIAIAAGVGPPRTAIAA